MSDGETKNLTRAAACQIIGVSRVTLWEWARDGFGPEFKTVEFAGRSFHQYPEDAVIAFADEYKRMVEKHGSKRLAHMAMRAKAAETVDRASEILNLMNGESNDG